MQCLLAVNNDAFQLSQFAHTSLPPLALQIVVLAGGAVLIVTVTVGRLVVVAVVLTMVYLVLVLVGVGYERAVSEYRTKNVMWESLTAVTVMTTFVTPDQKVSVVVVVTLVLTSSVIQVVVAGAVDIEVEVAHLLVSSSVEVTVLLSRPRFSITWASARRASRAARNSARLSAGTFLLASRRRRAPLVVAVTEAVNDPVSRAAACTTVGVILAQGSW